MWAASSSSATICPPPSGRRRSPYQTGVFGRRSACIPTRRPHGTKTRRNESAVSPRARGWWPWAAHPRVVAIGEIGLDFYRNLSPVADQERAFRAQLEIAEAAGLPIVIHCRDAWDETLAILESAPSASPVILHCFGGTMAHAGRAWRRGWFLGIGGALTFKKSEELREIVRAAPQQSVLLETDAPYLSPEPLRGRYPNEPARVAIVAERVARLWETDAADVASITTQNARRAFPGMAAPSPPTGEGCR